MKRQAGRGWVTSGAVFAVGLTLGTWANDRGSALRAGVPDSVALARTAHPLAAADETRASLALADLTPAAVRRLALAPGSTGAVIRAVAPGSAADRAALRVDDVILEIDRQAVGDAAGGRAALRAARGAGAVTMRVWRAGRPFDVILRHP